ncbi:MAG TPA: PsbP-related protein [Candidatus Saccharimonadales bacterium]|nr:PsbP-related protein [Candidatus Saccharimonadales bacterium]
MKIIVKSTTIFIYCFLFVFVGLVGLNGGISGITSLSLAQSNDTFESTESLMYNNPNLGFTLEYPSDWAKEESLTFISPPPSSNDAFNGTTLSNNLTPESIAVTTEVLLTNITLEEYSESAIGLLESQFPNFTLLNSFETALSGYPAHQIEYTYALDGLELKNAQIWAIADNIVYAITYGGTTEEFDSSLPVFESLMESFQLTEIQQ